MVSWVVLFAGSFSSCGNTRGYSSSLGQKLCAQMRLPEKSVENVLGKLFSDSSVLSLSLSISLAITVFGQVSCSVLFVALHRLVGLLLPAAAPAEADSARDFCDDFRSR